MAMAGLLSSATLSMSSLCLSSPESSSPSPPLLKSSFLSAPLRARLASSSSASGKHVNRRQARLCLPMATSSFMNDEDLSPEEVEKAYEALYGPAFSRLKKSEDEGFGRRGRERNARDNMEEKVVQIRRVTKVVKGGKQLSFRAIVVVGDRAGKVGVGIGKAKEVIYAVQKSAADARRHVIDVPLTKQKTFPHRAEAKYGAAKVMLRPAANGTGVLAGGSVRTMLEMAGVVNGLGKELGSKNPLNNARAVVEAIKSMKTFREVSEKRGIPMEVLWE